MRTIRTPLLAIACLLSAGCETDTDDTLADVEPSDTIATPGDEANTAPVETTSILRTDIDQPEEVDELIVTLEPLDATIGFPEGGATLDEGALAKLEQVVTSQQVREGGTIVLRGHSDAGGSDDANRRASLARAERVRDWMLERGVAKDRVEVIAFGEQNPVAPNALPDGSPNEQGRERNRRVDIRVDPVKTDAARQAGVADAAGRRGGDPRGRPGRDGSAAR